MDDAGRIWVSRTLNGITPALVDVLGADGSETEVPRGPKAALADVVWDLVGARLP